MTELRHALLLDTETSGLPEDEAAVCIEVGVIRYDLILGSPIESYASLIHTKKRNDAAHINGITDEMLKEAPQGVRVWKRVRALVKRSDVIVSHRTSFDRHFVPKEIGDLKPWACSKYDLQFPHGKPGDALVFLALAHDLGISHVHRVMSDCDLISRVFTKAHQEGHDLIKIVKEALRVKPRFVAQTQWHENAIVKEHGFQFDWKRKEWWRRMDLKKTKELPFRVKEVPLA